MASHVNDSRQGLTWPPLAILEEATKRIALHTREAYSYGGILRAQRAGQVARAATRTAIA